MVLLNWPAAAPTCEEEEKEYYYKYFDNNFNIIAVLTTQWLSPTTDI